MKMYLYSGNCRMCECGQETGLKDINGDMLYTGDIVILGNLESGHSHGFTAVVSDEYDATYATGKNTFEHRRNEDEEYDYFVMGVKDSCVNETDEWYFEKAKSYKDVIDGERWPNYGFSYQLEDN